MTAAETPSLPSAVVTPAPGRLTAVLLPLLALALAAWVLVQLFAERGPTVTVRCEEGHGLQAGDPLRYRGIAVGEIDRVELAPGLGSVLLRVRLDQAARGLARRGSRFWVVRPQVSLEGVRGLETVVGSRYLRVEPGRAGAAEQTEFVALRSSPLEEEVDPAGLELLLQAPARYSLAPGAPVLYRDFRVGTVLAVGLASDAASVELRCYIRPAYVQLVRENSRFWEAGGLELEVALLEGLRLELGSLSSLLVGAIAFATPDEPGAVVRHGHSFQLAAAPVDEWLAWRPTLPIGSELMPDRAPLVQLERAHVRFEASGLLGRVNQRSGWLVPLEGGVLGPEELLAPEDARVGSLVLEAGGQEQQLSIGPDWSSSGLVRLPVQLEVGSGRSWPYDRIRRPVDAEDCLVVLDSSIAPRALDAGRLTAEEGGFAVDGSLAFGSQWHGAAIVARRDGFLVGVLLVDGEGARVVLPPGDSRE